MNDFYQLIENFKRFYRDKALLVWMIVLYTVLMILNKDHFFRILFYSYLLYLTGNMLLSYNTKQRFLLNYIIAGLIGFLIAIMFPSFIMHPIESFIIIMGAGLFATMTGLAANLPQLQLNLFLFGNVRYVWIVAILLVLEVLTINQVNSYIIIAHLAGAASGYLFFYLQNNGMDPAGFLKFFYKKRTKPLKKKRNKSARPMTDEDYNRQRADEEKRIDAILDKIRESGYPSLSKEEKALLFKKSKQE